jgi:hypothetical protein
MDSTSVFLESFVAALRISRNILSLEGIDMYRHCTLVAPRTLWRKMAGRSAITEEDIAGPLFYVFFCLNRNVENAQKRYGWTPGSYRRRRVIIELELASAIIVFCH